MCGSYLELETWKVNFGQGQWGPHVVLYALRQRRTWTGKETHFKDRGIKSKRMTEVITNLFPFSVSLHECIKPPFSLWRLSLRRAGSIQKEDRQEIY